MSIRLLSAICAALSLSITPLLAQQQVNYQLSFPNAVHHGAQISVTFSGIPTDTLQVLMPRSSPGPYAVHEFAKNVYSVKATNSKGNPLSVNRPNLHQWHVTGHPGGAVTVRYTLFGDHADGTYTGIDETHAHSVPITFQRHGEVRTATIMLEETPTLEVVPFESANQAITPAMQQFRQAWLGSKAN